ncbi:MAG: preprotein translocase subunit SecE [Arsenophonus sp.]|nr:MAG: preprotein translocase subunit SecE [Arsenophonus sp.]
MKLKFDLQKKEKVFNCIKWMVSLIFLFISISSNYFLKHSSPVIRFSIVIICLIFCFFVVFQTTKGKLFLDFFKESKIEMYKVIWPSYKETLQTTFIVSFVTIFVSLILWGLDSILIYLISLIAFF